MEKQKKEEKEAEKKLVSEIRNLKLKRSMRRRENPGIMNQPAQKKRRMGEDKYVRVLQQGHQQEKRKEDTEEVLPVTERDPKRRKNLQEEQEKEEDEKPPVQKGEQWEENTEERWKCYVERREREQREEEKEREERILKARMKSKSYELLRLCKEMLEKEGETWKISKERRETERMRREEKQERLTKAKQKKIETMENIKNNKLQT